MKCPKCQADNREDAKFCDKCGHDLIRDGPAPPIDYSQPQSYIPKFLAEKILDTRNTLEGERKLVTVLFADVANYTSISEKLDPEEVHQIMYGCFKILMDEIHRYEGTIDKFMGDGVMALFGAPIAHEDHAQRACYAALAIQKAIGEYGEKIEKNKGVEFRVRVGIDSGQVIVGSVGNDLKMDYTAIGDPVNLASRIEGLAEPGTIYVTNDTFKLTEVFFHFKSLGKMSIKGKEEPIKVYRLETASVIETRLGAAIARGLSRFVGRRKELKALKEAFDKAKAGSGQVVGIVGEAGVGKSRLLLKFRESLSQEQHTYLEGRCLHYGSTMPYMPILDTLRAYFEIKDIEKEAAIKKRMKQVVKQLDVNLDTVLPPLHDILSLHVEDEWYLNLEPPQKRERTFEAIKNLLIASSQSMPLIITLEDLHWIDNTSEEFLDNLVESLANTRIMLILLYRSDYAYCWANSTSFGQFRVNELKPNLCIELVRSILEGADVASDLREFILSRTAGNPLFIEELTYSLLENGSIQKNNEQYVLIANASDIKVPDTIQGIIAARMDHLEENLKRTLQVASVIGRDFTYNILQSINEMREESKSYLINLQGLEFIYEKSLFPELEYSFKHTLIQEVAYNSLLVSSRREIHEKIGNAIEELYPDRLEEFYEVLAHHYSMSDNLGKAYHYLKVSGEKTSRHYSNWEAFRFYKKAIDILHKEPDTEENNRRGIEVRLLVEGPMRLLAYPEDALQILQEGGRISKNLDDKRSLATFYSSIGLYYAFKGDPVQGIRYSEKCFTSADKIKDVELMAPTGFDLCSSYVIAGDYYKTVRVAPKIIDLLETNHRESDTFSGPYNFNLYSALSAYYGLSIGLLGDFIKGESLCEKGLRFAQEIDNLYTLGFVEIMYGWLFTSKGSGRNAVQHLQNAVRYAEQGQIIPLLGLARMQLGYGYYLSGELQLAKVHLEKGLQIQCDAGFSILLSHYYYCLSMIYLDLGDYEKSLSYIEEAVKLTIENKEKQVEGSSRICMGRSLYKANPSQSSKAEEFILQGMQILNKLKLKPLSFLGYLALGELYSDTGQRETALEYLKKAEKLFQEKKMDYWMLRTREIMEMVKS